MNKSGIYKIINTKNGKFYLGSSKNLAQRKKKHKYELSKGKHHSSYLQNAYNKYGAKSFKFVIIEHVEESRLLEVEQHYLNTMKPYLEDVGYNMSKMATNCVLTGQDHWTYGLPTEEHHWYGKKHTKETRLKISKAQKGKLNHAYGKPSPNRGKPLSEETKAKLRIANTGKPGYWKGKKLPEETKEKMRQKAIGRPVSDKVINKSEEWIKNISKGKKGKGMGKDNPNAVKVVQFSIDGSKIKVFDTITQASESTNSNKGSIVSCCRGRYKTAGGYKWMYYDDYTKLNKVQQSSIS
jgi:hypothetical protein